MKRTVILGLLLVFTMLVCHKVIADEIDFGTVKNSVYRNEYFGLTLAIPSGWSVQEQETQQLLMDLGGQMVAGDDKNLEAAIKASELMVVNLLLITKYPIGEPVPFNPSFICIAERVRHMPGIKRGKDYHFHARKVLEAGQLEWVFPEDIYTEQLGGKDFDVMTIQTSILGQLIKQKLYATVLKGYALVCSVTFTNDEEESELDQVLHSLSFQ